MWASDDGLANDASRGAVIAVQGVVVGDIAGGAHIPRIARAATIGRAQPAVTGRTLGVETVDPQFRVRPVLLEFPRGVQPRASGGHILPVGQRLTLHPADLGHSAQLLQADGEEDVIGDVRAAIQNDGITGRSDLDRL